MREQVTLNNYNIKSMTVYVNERLRGAMNNKADKNKNTIKIKSNPSLKSTESTNYNNTDSSDNHNDNEKIKKLRIVSFSKNEYDTHDQED